MEWQDESAWGEKSGITRNRDARQSKRTKQCAYLDTYGANSSPLLLSSVSSRPRLVERVRVRVIEMWAQDVPDGEWHVSNGVNGFVSPAMLCGKSPRPVFQIR